MVKHFRIPGILAARLEELRVPVAVVLRRAGLPQDLFRQARILVSTPELFALWRAIGDVSKDPEIGLKLGTESKLERFQPMALAPLCTESLGEAIKHIARYKKLVAPEEVLSSSSGGEWIIQFRWVLAAEDVPSVLTDNCFAWILTIARHGSGNPISPLRIELVESRPADYIRVLERHFGCTVAGGAPRDAMIFRETDASLPFLTQNSELLEMLAPHLESELQEHSATEDSFVELVRGAVRQRLAGRRPSIESIAHDLHMSTRTLQRRLQESGTAFQRVLDEARHQMATYYLRNSAMELTETAFLLGYEDAYSFSRAFRTWEGVPPSDWRATKRADSADFADR